MTDFTRREKRECALREVRMRREVYPNLISRGRMSRSDAEREIKLMEAIAEDYREADLFSNAPSEKGFPALPHDDYATGRHRPPPKKRGSR